MSDIPDYKKGVGVAICSAGPIGTLVVWLGLLISAPSNWRDTLPSLLIVMSLSLFIGAFVAAVPAIFGVSVMAHIGRRSEGARTYAAWGLAGAFGGAIFMTQIAMLFEGADPFLSPHPFVWLMTLHGAATGALCALLARRYVRWLPEESE